MSIERFMKGHYGSTPLENTSLIKSFTDPLENKIRILGEGNKTLRDTVLLLLKARGKEPNAK